jgi:Icc-related predicted phosphoesterase
MPTRDTVRIAAVSDMHYGKQSQGMLQSLFSQIAERADVLVMPGDLTDYGLPEEARVLARDLTACVKIPIVAVLGNHDFESDQSEEVARILTDAGVHRPRRRLGRGSGSGVRRREGVRRRVRRGTLGPWGERAIKVFVQEAVNEALKLESALARLKTTHRIAIVHYAPIVGTVEGEPVEIYPGSARVGSKSRSCATRSAQ